MTTTKEVFFLKATVERWRYFLCYHYSSTKDVGEKKGGVDEANRLLRMFCLLNRTIMK